MAKRNQLAVGQEWAYHRGRTHYIGESYVKVIIEAVEPHEEWRSGIHQVEKGLGVKVKIGSRWGHQTEIVWRSTVIQLSQLFIPWAEYEVQKAEYKVQKEIAEKQAGIAKAERIKFQEEIYQPAYKEFINAVEAISGHRLSGYTKINELPIEVLKAITELVKEKAVA